MIFHQKRVGEIINTVSSFLFIIFIMSFFTFMIMNVKKLSKETVTNYLSNDIQFHDQFIDLYGMAQRMLDKKAIEGLSIFKTSNGKLTDVCEQITETDIDASVSSILPIFDFCNENSIPCVYLTSLLPTNNSSLPYGGLDYSHYNAKLLGDQIRKSGIDVLDLRDAIQGDEELFYYTDHHWTTETSFLAFQKVVAYISEYAYADMKYVERDEYEEYVIPDSFLGSYGIKVGRSYAGRDNFKVLVPQDELAFIFESYDSNGNLSMTKSGSWMETLMDQEILNNPDYNNKYNAWLNTQAIENRIINENVENDTKILLIAHSYGRPLAQYMSLCFREVRMLDPQEGRFSGNYLDYINEYRPDVVLFLGEFEGEIIGTYDTSTGGINQNWGGIETYEMLMKLEMFLLPEEPDDKIDFESIDVDDHQFYAYCLKAECSIGNSDKINELTRYLIEHEDEDGDGIPGWGLLFEWDAFSDGSTNPAGQVYAIEVVNVLDAFMDALDSDALDEELIKQVKEIVYQVTVDWNRNYFTNSNDTGKNFYWYSSSPNDNIECVNISAKMAGVFARILYECPELFSESEKEVVYSNIDACVDRVMEMVSIDGNLVTWPYLSRNDTVNDCIHHAFILEGLRDFQKYRGLSVNYNVSDYTEYIRKCIYDGFIYSNPDHTSYRCFDTDAVRWIGNTNLEEEVLRNAYERYFNEDTDIRQMAFLFNALASFEAE